jgi:aminoglycoside/choline kinase family phosphotransferase
MPTTDPRLLQIELWLRDELCWPVARLAVASADASFRRYFRVWNHDGDTRVVMDAPPDKEDIGPWLKVTRLLADCGVHVPRIEAVDAARGLILLEDLGSTPMLSELQAGADPDRLYGAALAALADIQQRGHDGARQLPPYDRTVLMREMQLMPEWFCARHLGLQPDAPTAALLTQTMEFLAAAALAQPQVLVHRDYHSRNLMITPLQSPGIIDYQDALHGPVSYDLVSLLKDCYIEWPRARVVAWVEAHRSALVLRGVQAGADAAEFLRWFDLMGLQRHIKVLGIFSRLWYRDGKRGYLADLPLTLKYVREAAAACPELAAFSRWLEGTIAPRLAAANAREMKPVK